MLYVRLLFFLVCRFVTCPHLLMIYSQYIRSLLESDSPRSLTGSWLDSRIYRISSPHLEMSFAISCFVIQTLLYLLCIKIIFISSYLFFKSSNLFVNSSMPSGSIGKRGSRPVPVEFPIYVCLLINI